MLFRTLLSVLKGLDRLGRKAVVLLITLYQKTVSPWYKVCRFEPSCSEYGRQAFDRFPFPHALGLTVARILRCHPFHKGGYDPLPERRQ